MTHRTNTESSGHQEPGRSQEGEHKLPTEKTVKKSTRCDGSRHSVLETLGQTQSGGDDGDGVGCGEFNDSKNLATRKNGVGLRIEYYTAQTGGMGSCNK